MQEHARRGGRPRLDTGSEQRADHTGQDVAAAGGREIWRVDAVRPHLTIWCGDERRRTFEHDDRRQPRGGAPDVLEPPRLDVLARAVDQASELTGVRREHRWRRTAYDEFWMPREDGETVRVDEHRKVGVENRAHDVLGVGVTAESRAGDPGLHAP